MQSAERDGGRAEHRPETLAVNVMTWWLCGYACNSHYISLPWALARAKKNLAKKIEIVGITEDMPAFFRAMRASVHFLSELPAQPKVT